MQWVFFDLGNTLLDESRAHAARHAQLVERLSALNYDLKAADLDRAMHQAAAAFAPRLISRALEILVGDQVDHGDLLARARYDKTLERPYPGVSGLLRDLRERYEIGVIANQRAGTEKRLRALGLWPQISLCLASAEVGLAKPDPAIFELALARAGCASADAIMVGDRIDNDIAPARRAGWRTIRVLQGYAASQQPRSGDERADFSVRATVDVGGMLLR